MQIGWTLGGGVQTMSRCVWRGGGCPISECCFFLTYDPLTSLGRGTQTTPGGGGFQFVI